ncbi:MAG: DegT/DnrJ/EryC1/StrS family aminotransferase [Coriobacteriales bacterium]|jgi:dTDP-4-amino-4,6-dideoxygalactose transaminase
MEQQRIAVTRSSMPPFEEYVAEIADIWDSRWLTNFGTKHNQLIEELKPIIGDAGIALFTNGHNALEAVLAAFNFGEGEAITTPFTFASTTHAISRTGLTPVFCDIDPETCCIDVSQIESLITERTKAIVPVHVYGMMCDADAIDAIARKHGLKVIYDAAHAFGARKAGVPAGMLGDASMFSFHATKVFHSIEGGCVVYKDEALAERIREQQNFGMDSAGEVNVVAGNAKMNEFQAAMGLCNLRHLDDAIAARKAATERYRERLGDAAGVTLLEPQSDVESNYAYFPAFFDPAVFEGGRGGVAEKLAADNILARKYFYPLTCDFPCYAGLPHADVPVARKMADSVLALPLFEDLTPEMVDRICDCILS